MSSAPRCRDIEREAPKAEPQPRRRRAPGLAPHPHGDTPHNLANGKQVSAVNVVIQKVKIVPGTVRDASGSPTQDTTVVGTGEATVLRGGTAIAGTWNRASLNDGTTFTDAAGAAIEFAPGTTFIHLVPQERPVTVQ